jgi:hypothetical protein
VTDAPGSPRAGRLATPSWLDTRLVLGVLLVLVSVVVGARLLATADRSQLVWAAGSDLAAGSTLAAGDLQPAEVRLFDSSGAYLPATAAPPVGYVLDRAVARGELLPRQALSRPGDDVDLRLVTVPVLPERYPRELAKGQQVDVWTTPDADAVGAPADDGGEAGPGPGGASRLVLPGLTVQSVPEQGGGLGGATPERSVVLAVPPDDVESLLSAMASGRLDLVRVPTGRDTGDLAPAAEDG